MINILAYLGFTRLGESFAVFNFAFEGKGNISAKILGEKWLAHGPPPPRSYAYAL